MENTEKQIKKGVTLIEIMMVVAIIGIMSSLVFVNIKRDGSIVQSAGRELATDLRALKRTALNGKLPAGVTGYACSFRFNPSENSYSFSGTSKASPTGGCALFSSYFTKSFSNGVTLSPVTIVDFSVPHGKPNTGVTYTLRKGSCSMTVIVSADGDIVEGGLSGC